MNHTLLRSCALLLLLGVGLFGTSAAHAVVTCSTPSMTSLSFGTVDPLSTQKDATATFSITCENNLFLQTRAATICVSIGHLRQMQSGSATLNFQLYQDPSHSIIWGSQFAGSPAPLKFNVILGPRDSDTFSATLNGRVLLGQTAVISGAYSKSFPANNDARVTVNAPISSSPPGSCNTSPSGSLYIPFTVSANVVKKCTVEVAPLDFGSNGLLTTAVTASTLLNVNCSVGTAYNVGMDAGMNGGGNINARKMVLAGNIVGYQLYRDPARSQVWGNTIGSNTATGIGNGITTQSLTVYGRVPNQTTPPAGTYADVVVVTLTY